MGCYGRNLESIAGFQRPGWLTLYRKFETAFQDVGGLDTGMRVSRNGHSGLNLRLYKKRDVSGCWTISL